MMETSYKDGGAVAASKPPGDASLNLRKQVATCPIRLNIRAEIVTT